jgi:hypothetical protein
MADSGKGRGLGAGIWTTSRLISGIPVASATGISGDSAALGWTRLFFFPFPVVPRGVTVPVRKLYPQRQQNLLPVGETTRQSDCGQACPEAGNDLDAASVEAPGDTPTDNRLSFTSVIFYSPMSWADGPAKAP